MQRDPARLPPLDLLLTFEAAARLLSFTRAGHERFVTQSAVSRQIRALEDDLGVALFRRAHRSLVLTDEGRALFDAVRASLPPLRTAVAKLRAPNAREVLTLTTTPGLASLWLIPRLARFTREHPGVDVRIDASFARREIDAEGIDVALRYCPATFRDGAKLFGEDVVPVCSPALLAPGRAPLARPADLSAHTLLLISESGGANPQQEWQPWLESMGVSGLQPAASLAFSGYDDVIGAAVLGQGVALGRRPLVDALLASGQLVAPIEGTISSARAYFVLVADRARARPSVRAFERWLLDQARGATG